MFGKPQKALHLYIDEEKKKPKHTGEAYAVFEKFDGWYMYVDFIDGKWSEIKSRAGRAIPSVQHLNVFKTITPTENMRLIFEGTIPGMEFKDLNGIFNRLSPVQETVVFKLHDVLTEENKPFNLRYKQALELEEQIDSDLVQVVKLLSVSRFKDAWLHYYEEILSQGGEGVILKQAFGLYHPDKRNHTLMKIKCDLTLDLIVIGLIKGDKKYANTLGALQVQEKDGTVHTISGMTDAERNYFWSNPNEIIGKVVEVQAMKRISNGSLREPRFKAIRFDKSFSDID